MEEGALGRGVIFVVAFLGIFAFILGSMPSQYYYFGNAPEYTERTTPSKYWTPEDIKTLLSHGNTTVTQGPIWDYDYIEIDRGSLGIVYVRILWHKNNFWTVHYNWGLFGWGEGDIEPTPLSETEILTNMDESGNFSRFEMTCDHHNYVTYFAFNETNYNNLTEAIIDGEVIMDMGMDWEYESGILSGWDIVARLLFFQPIPEMGDPLLTAIISLPIWTSIGFLAFIIITKIVEMLPFT